MAKYRKLNKPSDQRKAMMRNLVTSLIWNGRIETTEARAKEVRKFAEKYISMAVRECDNTVDVTRSIKDSEGTKKITFTNDAPSKLAARRKMLSYLYNIKEEKQDNVTTDWSCCYGRVRNIRREKKKPARAADILV